MDSQDDDIPTLAQEVGRLQGSLPALNRALERLEPGDPARDPIIAKVRQIRERLSQLATLQHQSWSARRGDRVRTAYDEEE